MTNTREKLIELIQCSPADIMGNHGVGALADHLIANGVTVQKWIPAANPPTRKDADKYGRVLAMELGMISIVNYRGPINYPDRFPYWMPLPEAPTE